MFLKIFHIPGIKLQSQDESNDADTKWQTFVLKLLQFAYGINPLKFKISLPFYRKFG